MKRAYETPVAEKVSFRYQEQVAASTSSDCISAWINAGTYHCESDQPTLWEKKNT